MVHQDRDEYDYSYGDRGFRTKKFYPPLPPKDRLQRWLQRTYVNSAAMRDDGNCQTTCKLKAKLAAALGLNDPKVIIDSEGRLWHASNTTSPIAVYVHGS